MWVRQVLPARRRCGPCLPRATVEEAAHRRVRVYATKRMRVRLEPGATHAKPRQFLPASTTYHGTLAGSKDLVVRTDTVSDGPG